MRPAFTVVFVFCAALQVSGCQLDAVGPEPPADIGDQSDASDATSRAEVEAPGFCAVTSCDDGNECTADSCDDAAASCSNVAVEEQRPCKEGDKCAPHVCLAGSGACTAAQPLECDDGNTCTDDACDAIIGCVHQPSPGDCDDGDACTKETCSDGSCLKLADVVCDDGNPCTADSCDKVAGCRNEPQDVSCDDGSACTVADRCEAGVCAGVVGLMASMTQTTAGLLPQTGVRAIESLGDKGWLIGLSGGPSPLGVAPLTGDAWTEIEVPTSNVTVQGFTALKSGERLAFGAMVTAGLKSGGWVGRIDLKVNKVTATLNAQSAGGKGMFFDGAPLSGAEALMVGGEVMGSSNSGRVQVVTVGNKITAKAPTLLPQSLLTAVTQRNDNASPIICGAKEGLNESSRALLAVYGVGGKITISRTFGSPGGTCLDIERRSDGDLVAAGMTRLRASSEPVVWRLSSLGQVKRVAKLPTPTFGAFHGLALTAKDHVFAFGFHGSGDDLASLVSRFTPELDAPTSVSGPASDEDVLAWRAGRWLDDGRLILGGDSSPSAGGRPALQVRDAWGHTSCGEQQLCEGLVPGDCAKGECARSDCLGVVGCTLTPHAGHCDDGQVCTVGARCESGKCVAGQARYRVDAKDLPLSDKLLRAAPGPSGDVLVATLAGGKDKLQVNRWRAAGGVTNQLTSDVEVKELTTLSAGHKTMCLMGVDAAGAAFRGCAQLTKPGPKPLDMLNNSVDVVGLVDRADRVMTAHLNKAGFVQIEVHQGGLLNNATSSLTLSSKPGHSVGRLAGVASGKTGLLLAAVSAAGVPMTALISHSGKPSAWVTVAASKPTSPDYLGSWAVDHSVLSFDDGRRWLRIPRFPAVGVALDPAWQKQEAPRVGVFTNDGHLDSVEWLFNDPKKPPNRLLGGVMAGPQAALIVATREVQDDTFLMGALTTPSGEKVSQWQVAVSKVEQTHGDVLRLSDGSMALVTLSTSLSKVGQVLHVRRMSPWGHTDCASSSQCADESGLSCDTGTPCAQGICEPLLGCSTTTVSTCEHYTTNPCAVAGKCSTSLVCTLDSGEPTKDCDDGNPCTTDACKPKGCDHAPVPDNTVCDDGLACTVGETCSAGACVAAASSCP